MHNLETGRYPYSEAQFPSPAASVVSKGSVKYISLNCGVEIQLLACEGSILRIKTPDTDGTLQDIMIDQREDRLHNSFSLPVRSFSIGENEECAWAIFDMNLVSPEYMGPTPASGTLSYKLYKDNRLEIRIDSIHTMKAMRCFQKPCYLNLSGLPGADLSSHYIRIPSKDITSVGTTPVASRYFSSSEGIEVLNLTRPREIYHSLVNPPHCLKVFAGFNHYYEFPESRQRPELRFKAIHALSGRTLAVYSNLHRVRFQTANPQRSEYLDDSQPEDSMNNSTFCCELREGRKQTVGEVITVLDFAISKDAPPGDPDDSAPSALLA